MEKKIIQLRKQGFEISEIARRLDLDSTVVRRVLNQDSKKVIKTKTVDMKGLFDKSNNIDTKAQIGKINREAWKLYEKLLTAGKDVMASNLLQTIMKQIELTSKKLGELNKKDDKNKLIPKDFIEYFMDCLDEEKYFNEES